MKVILTQLPLPATVHEPDDANQPLAAALLLSHAGRSHALDGVEPDQLRIADLEQRLAREPIAPRGVSSFRIR